MNLQPAQISNNYCACPACDGTGLELDFYQPTFEEMMSSIWECRACNGRGLILQEPNQSGDLCRSSVQSPDVVGQESTL